MSNPIQVIQVTLSSKKVVVLHQMKISHSETAAQMAAPKSNGDRNVLQFCMQSVLLKLLLWKIDGKEIDPIQREKLDELFTVPEYTQLLKVIGKVSGGDESEKEPEVAFVAATTGA
jgi:hypothetical protein